MKPKTELLLWQQKLQDRMALQEALRKNPDAFEELFRQQHRDKIRAFYEGYKDHGWGHMNAVVNWHEDESSVKTDHISMAAE